MTVRIPIAKEGYPYLVPAFLVGVIVLLFSSLYGSILLILAAGFALFFRSPLRVARAVDSEVVAPADGRVMQVDEVMENSYFGQTVRRISIFLSIFDVHMNYAPVSGTVDYMHYRKGSFRNAMNNIASVTNENNTIGIKWNGTTMAIRQIAGMIARRIVCRCTVGETIRAGEMIGMIKFSSRVDIFLPLEAKITVRNGQKVRGGETVIARME